MSFIESLPIAATWNVFEALQNLSDISIMLILVAAYMYSFTVRKELEINIRNLTTLDEIAFFTSVSICFYYITAPLTAITKSLISLYYSVETAALILATLSLLNLISSTPEKNSIFYSVLAAYRTILPRSDSLVLPDVKYSIIGSVTLILLFIMLYLGSSAAYMIIVLLITSFTAVLMLPLPTLFYFDIPEKQLQQKSN